ncbi:MAG: ASPIC/UnbV domain-containing protein, partial [Acidobacteria bacterium]|nr:ASPIC/UnbV domain-containing protein [Acidobacteriota bacterium]
RPTGSVSNRSGYGARITMKAGGKRQVSEVHAARSYQSSSDKTVHFGLGEAVNVESLCIRWPSGRTESFAVDGVDRLLNVVEGKGDKVESCGTDG